MKAIFKALGISAVGSIVIFSVSLFGFIVSAMLKKNRDQ
jgi:hypothetical protein